MKGSFLPRHVVTGQGAVVFQLKESRFRLGRRKKIFMMREIGNWSKLPREVVNAPS